MAANVTGFFYTVWPCFAGEEEEESTEPGFLEKINIAVEDKLNEFKKNMRTKFTSRRENWKARK